MIPLPSFATLKLYGGAILAAMLLGSVILYVANAERNRALVKAYEKETERNLLVIAHQDEQIRALNERLRGNNARWLELIQREQKRYAAARAEADRIIAERDTITAELAASRRDWQEAIANDEHLAEFVAHPVPGAVWDRMRHAAGQ